MPRADLNQPLVALKRQRTQKRPAFRVNVNIYNHRNATEYHKIETIDVLTRATKPVLELYRLLASDQNIDPEEIAIIVGKKYVIDPLLQGAETFENWAMDELSKLCYVDALIGVPRCSQFPDILELNSPDVVEFTLDPQTTGICHFCQKYFTRTSETESDSMVVDEFTDDENSLDACPRCSKFSTFFKFLSSPSSVMERFELVPVSESSTVLYDPLSPFNHQPTSGNNDWPYRRMGGPLRPVDQQISESSDQGQSYDMELGSLANNLYANVVEGSGDFP